MVLSNIIVSLLQGGCISKQAHVWGLDEGMQDLGRPRSERCLSRPGSVLSSWAFGQYARSPKLLIKGYCRDCIGSFLRAARLYIRSFDHGSNHDRVRVFARTWPRQCSGATVLLANLNSLASFLRSVLRPDNCRGTVETFLLHVFNANQCISTAVRQVLREGFKSARSAIWATPDCAGP